MNYDVNFLLKKYQSCLNEIAIYFADLFRKTDYTQNLPRKIKRHLVEKPSDLDAILKGPGFYFIATDISIKNNPCTLRLDTQLNVVYRGHSYNVRERIESHLFYDEYLKKDSGRRFTVSMKLDGKNINIDKVPLIRNTWVVVTHSMPKSNILIREAAEVGFDDAFGKPVGSDR